MTSPAVAKVTEEHGEAARALVARWEHGDDAHRKWLQGIATPDIASALAAAEARGAANAAKAAKFFAAMWQHFVDGDNIDACDLWEALKHSGLTETRPATAADAVEDLCEGDDAMFLNDDGKALLALAKENDRV